MHVSNRHAMVTPIGADSDGRISTTPPRFGSTRRIRRDASTGVPIEIKPPQWWPISSIGSNRNRSLEQIRRPIDNMAPCALTWVNDLGHCVSGCVAFAFFFSQFVSPPSRRTITKVKWPPKRKHQFRIGWIFLKKDGKRHQRCEGFVRHDCATAVGRSLFVNRARGSWRSHKMTCQQN